MFNLPSVCKWDSVNPFWKWTFISIYFSFQLCTVRSFSTITAFCNWKHQYRQLANYLIKVTKLQMHYLTIPKGYKTKQMWAVNVKLLGWQLFLNRTGWVVVLAWTWTRAGPERSREGGRGASCSPWPPRPTQLQAGWSASKFEPRQGKERATSTLE